MLRPREHYQVHGPNDIPDDALLALAIGLGVGSGRTALDIARDLLEAHGDLAGLARAPVTSLQDVPGMGPARAVRLHAALTAGRRARRPRTPPPRLSRPEDAWMHLRPHVAGRDREELHALYLGPRNRLRAHKRLTHGSERFTVVDPRQVYREAVAVCASGVILAHNHPSGDPTPSPEDIDCTRRVAAAGRVLGIPLVDHLVVTEDRWTSLAEEGHLRAPAGRAWSA